MKRLALAVVLALSVTAALAAVVFAAGTTGNGAPNGAHYNLNIIGVPKDKTADMDGNNGARIFVPLWGKTSIWLTEGNTFKVLDANGTDADGARFMLPNPDPENDGTTTYQVWARALGKPGGSATMTTCAYDAAGELWCSTEYNVYLERKTGKSSFTNVTRELLYIYADYDSDGVVERVPLFGDELQDYFWEYDNQGLRHAQLRFYEIPYTLPAQ